MEIKYENINKLEDAYKQLNQLMTLEISSLIDDDAYGIDNSPYTEDAIQKLLQIDSEIKNFFSDDFIDIELFDEIELNIVNIENEKQLVRYLKLIRSKVHTLYELTASLTDYENYTVKYWGDIISEGIKSEGFFHPTKMLINDPATNLRVSYLRVIEQLLVTRDNIDGHLTPGEDIHSMKRSDSSNFENQFIERTLIIADPNRRLYFDKWVEKIRAVRDRIDQSLKVITAINGTRYAFDSGNKGFDVFITWGNNLTNTLPDGIFSYEIMNEIDVNLLELKTKREKDRYLQGVANGLEGWAHTFKMYTRTHPDYRKRESDWADDGSGEIVEIETQALVEVDNWKKLNYEKSKYTLNSFYSQLLILSQVLTEIANYAKNLLDPEQPIILQNELDMANHRLLLFHRLGLFKPLEKKYFNLLGPGKFAKLLKTILGINDNEVKSETFRKAVENFIKEVDDIKVSKPTITKIASNKVDAYLVEMDLFDLINNEKE